jgi:hypothetical protein
MPLTIRPALSRGPINGWLDSRHVLVRRILRSRAHGFGPLRVINDDDAQPRAGLSSTGIATRRLSPMSSTARWSTGTALASPR